MRTCVFSWILLMTSTAFGQSEQAEPNEFVGPGQLTRLELHKGGVHVFASENRIRSVDSFDSEVVEIQAAAPRGLRITAKDVGVTQMKVVEEDGNIRTVRIAVRGDTRLLSDSLRQLYPDVELKLFALNEDSVVVRGRVESETEEEQIVAVCEQFFESVLNQLQVGNGTAKSVMALPGQYVVRVAVSDVTTGSALAPDALRQSLGKFVRARTAAGKVLISRARLTAEAWANGSAEAYLLVEGKLPKETRAALEKGPVALELAEKAGVEPDLHQEILDLHKDVKRLIELLEKRRAADSSKAFQFDNGADANASGPAVDLFLKEHGYQKAPVLLSFGAEWCPPCQRIQPEIDKLVGEGKPIVSVDITKDAELSKAFNVNKIPAFVLFAGGKELGRTYGARMDGVEALLMRLEEQRD